MTPQAELNAAAELMAACLRTFKRTAQAAREREEDVILAPAELWESSDEFALASFDLAKERMMGAQRLPFVEEPMTTREFLDRLPIPTETPEESEELDRIERTSPAVMHPLGETA